MEDCALSAHNHDHRQQSTQTRTDDSIANNETICYPMPHQKLTSMPILNNLIHEFTFMKDLGSLNVAVHGEEFINSAFMKSSMVRDSLINLQRHQKRKSREKIRKALQEGMPVHNTRLFKHCFGNHKPMASVLFKVDPSLMDLQMGEAAKKAEEQVLKFFIRHDRKKLRIQSRWCKTWCLQRCLRK